MFQTVCYLSGMFPSVSLVPHGIQCQVPWIKEHVAEISAVIFTSLLAAFLVSDIAFTQSPGVWGIILHYFFFPAADVPPDLFCANCLEYQNQIFPFLNH